MRHAVLGAALLSTVVFAPPALADDAACIAASESEATLQKAVKLREALKQAALCADPSCPAEVRTECSQRIVKMNADMPTVVLAVTDENGNDLAAVDVTLDGAPLTSTIDGKAVSIDPGSHVLHFEAAGKPPVEKTVVLREGEKDRHISVMLGVKPEVVLPPPTVETSPWNTRKTLAVAAGGLGIVGLGVGAGLGAAAISDWSSAKNACNTTSCPASTRGTAESNHNSAVTLGDVSTVGFVAGIAALAGGAVLWFTAPKGDAPPPHPEPIGGVTVTPALGPGIAGVSLGGRFW